MITIENELPPITVGVGPRECCQLQGNLEYYYLALELVVLRCRRCGARHFEMTAQPGQILTDLANSAMKAYREWEEVQNRIHPCCQVASNLEMLESGNGTAVYTCKICQRRHYAPVLQPGVIGVKL